MKILLLVMMFLLASACMAGQAGQDWKTVGPPIIAALDVDAQGRVVHAQLLGKDVLPQLQSLTEQATRDWQFVPATVDGKPAPARTYAIFNVEMHELNGSQQLRLHYLVHGPGRVFVEMPAYPAEMLRQLVEAAVVVDFTVNGDGNVSDAHVVTAKTSGGVRGAAFYRAAVEAVEKDRFLPELVDGRPVVTHVREPYGFAIDGYVADPLRHAQDAPHDKVGKDSIDVTHFADVPVALDSPLRFVSAHP
jgi:TonB family protein